MRQLMLFTVLSFFLVGPAAGFAATAATQVDALIKILVDKKILTAEEAAQLKDQIVYDEKTIREENFKKDIPQWVQDLKLSGDFRLRYQYEKRNTGDASERDQSRGRIRMRLGVDTKVNDKVALALGIATDGGNPRSNNYSFGNSFAKDGLVLNYAYVDYTPKEWLKLSGGQMKNPIWEPMEFLWDSDITPQGAALSANYKLNDSIRIVGLLSGFQVSEISTNEADPFMYVAQGGIQGKLLEEKADYKIIGSFYGMDNIAKTALANRSNPSTNTTNSAGQYVFHYSAPAVGAEFGLNDPFGEDFPVYIPRIGLFGEYLNNPSPDEGNVAWMMGGYLGNSKVNGWGTWKITGAYKSIGQEAWLDVFPDSEFYSGATDVKGYENIFEVGLAKNVTFVVDYYRTERIKASKQSESLIQGDVNFKF